MDTGVATYRFSVEEFNKLGEAGIFDEDDRVELLDGEIILMSPIGRQHAGIVMRLIWTLQRRLGDAVLLNPQNPAVLGDYSEPLPDLTLVRPKSDFYTSGHPRPQDIFLLIEVSDTTLLYDRERKLVQYADHAIAEVWIVDVKARRLEQFREPVAGRYSISRAYDRADEISIAAFPDIAFRVEELIG